MSLDSQPPEIVHRILFGTGLLSVQDVAAVRETCKYLAFCVQPTGLDLEYWRSLLAPIHLVSNGWGDALLVHFRREGYSKEAGDEALGWASFNNHFKLVEFLLADERLCPISLRTWCLEIYGHRPTGRLESPLVLSILGGAQQAFEIIYADPRVDPSSQNNRAVIMASATGRTEMLGLLLADPRVDPTTQENCAISASSRNGYPETLELLLADPRTNPADRDNSAIIDASCRGSTNTVVLLLDDPRVNPGARNNYAIKTACRLGKSEIVRLLLADPRVDPTSDKHMAMVRACRAGRTEVVRLLVEDGRCNPDIPFRRACENGHEDIVALLLPNPQVNPRGHKSFALKKAALNGHLGIVRLLLEDGRADPSVGVEILSRPNIHPRPFVLALLKEELQRRAAAE